MNRSLKWLAGCLVIVVTILAVSAICIVVVDPYFHYHYPLTDRFHYGLYNQRSQNDGIIRHFDYDALLIGNSYIENTRTTELDGLFGVSSIKTPFSGATYREMNDNVERALLRNEDLKLVVRVIPIAGAIADKDSMSWELGEYPFYLYDDNVFNDVKYLFNGEVLSRIYLMIEDGLQYDIAPGIDSFDDYSAWMFLYDFGVQTVSSDRVITPDPAPVQHLSKDEEEMIRENVVCNMTSVACDYPAVEFYYFLNPDSILYWRDKVEDGSVYCLNEAERIIIEECIKYDNIHLFSFNDLTGITTDLNNYRDKTHYGIWINSLILKFMSEDKGRLTVDTYEKYLEDELNYYLSYDYAQLNEQPDFVDDYEAESVIRGMEYDEFRKFE